jgi:cobalt-precorrin 5A hydrolase
LGATVIVAGVGCRRNAPAEDVRAAIVAALERAGLQPDALDCIATSELKIGEPGIEEAAADLGIRLVCVGNERLRAASGWASTNSDRVRAITGLPSLSESAALAACGPYGRLVLRRIVVRTATCALAEGEGVS